MTQRVNCFFIQCHGHAPKELYTLLTKFDKLAVAQNKVQKELSTPFSHWIEILITNSLHRIAVPSSNTKQNVNVMTIWRYDDIIPNIKPVS